MLEGVCIGVYRYTPSDRTLRAIPAMPATYIIHMYTCVCVCVYVAIKYILYVCVYVCVCACVLYRV